MRSTKRRITLPRHKKARQAKREARAQEELRKQRHKLDSEFMQQFQKEMKDFAGRPFVHDSSKLALGQSAATVRPEFCSRPQLLGILYHLGHSPLLAAKYNDKTLHKLVLKAQQQAKDAEVKTELSAPDLSDLFVSKDDDDLF